MVRRLFVAERSVPVEDRPAERGALHRVAVAPARAMPAGDDELELARARLSEQPDQAIGQDPVGTVQLQEDLADHRLLVTGQDLIHARLHDVPVVVDLQAQGMIEGETKVPSLRLGQRSEQRRHQRFRRTRRPDADPGLPDDPEGRGHGGQGEAGGGGPEKRTAG
jgi:hypothetical protein